MGNELREISKEQDRRRSEMTIKAQELLQELYDDTSFAIDSDTGNADVNKALKTIENNINELFKMAILEKAKKYNIKIRR